MKLDGVRVVDLSTFLPGPYLTMMLADHGAEVIKVEAPGGDAGRQIGLSDGDSTVFFRNLNRGKSSVTLDLKIPAHRDVVLDLVAKADVFIESFRPGVMKRLGLDHSTLLRLNPRLVYCSISAHGQKGPDAGLPAHDLAIEAKSGVLSLNLGQDGQPAMPGIPIADIVSGLHALAGVLMALYRCRQTGKGDFVDISMLDSMVAAMPNVMGPTFAEGRQPDPKEERTTGGAAFYQVYPTADGRHIVLGGQEMKFVEAVLSKLGRSDLIPLCARGPGPHQRPVIEALREIFQACTVAEWTEWFSDVDACFAPVATLPEALADPQIAHRGLILRDPQGRPHIGTPIVFECEPGCPVLDVPALGALRDGADTALKRWCELPESGCS